MVKKVAQKCTSVADEVALPGKEVALHKDEVDASPSYSGLPDAKRTHKAPTVQDIIVDPITQLASEHWSSRKKASHFRLYSVVSMTNSSTTVLCRVHTALKW